MPPRYRRSLEDTLKDLAGNQRAITTHTLAVEELQELGSEYIGPGAITADKLAENAIDQSKLDEQLRANLDQLNTDLTQAQEDILNAHANVVDIGQSITDMEGRLDSAGQDLVDFQLRLDDEILPAINDAAASPITDARLIEGSLTLWPFQGGAVPSGALAEGAVTANDLADFSVGVLKINDNRHRIY